MRVGALWHHTSANNYRALAPLSMLGHRGHEIVMPPENGSLPDNLLVSCDAVLIYRRYDAKTCATIRRLKDARVAVIWDNDDDFLHLHQSREFRRLTGSRNNRHVFAETLRAARLADVVTVTTETLAEVMRSGGLRDVRTIENYLTLDPPRVPHRDRGLTVGWIAGLEHLSDATSLGLPQTLRRLQEQHPNLEVTCVGVDLRLRERYRHARFVPFPRLVDVMADFTIGIAPISDTPFNRARSNIKVKEYAASHVPWLASPVTPYAGLGERQGGRLVPDDQWFEALDSLIRDASAREQMRRAGAAWSREQTIAANIGAYESLLEEVVERVKGHRPRTISRSPAHASMAAPALSDGRAAVKIPQRFVGGRRS